MVLVVVLFAVPSKEFDATNAFASSNVSALEVLQAELGGGSGVVEERC